MRLAPLDWIVIVGSTLLCYIPALFYGRRAGRSPLPETRPVANLPA